MIWSISASLVRAAVLTPADLQSLGLADPAAGFGFGDAADQVVADLGEVGTFVTSVPFPMPAPHPHAACRPQTAGHNAPRQQRRGPGLKSQDRIASALWS